MKLFKKNAPIQAKASIWYTVCNFFQKGIAFIVVPIYARMLTTDEYGEWTVFQSWRDILIVVATLNLYAGVYTKTLVDNKDDRDRYTSSMQGLGTLISLVLFGVYILTHKWCNAFFDLNTLLMLMLFIYFIVHPAFAFWTTRQRVEYKYKKMVAVTIVMSVLTPLVSIYLVKYTALRAKGLILGFLIVHDLISMYFYIIHFIRGKCFFSAKYWKYALKFNIPLIPHYLSLIALNQSDKIMVKHYISESDAGKYGLAYQIASAINVLIMAINGSRVPWTYEQLKEKKYDGIKNIVNALVLLMGVLTLLASLLSPEFIRIMGKEEYHAALYAIPVVTLGVYYTFVYDLFSTIEFYYSATKYVMVASITGAILNIFLNVIFIPQYGFIAAAYTTLVCYIVFMFMHYFFAGRVLKKNNIKKNIYDIKTIAFLSLGLSILCLGAMFTYKNLIIRLVLIIAIIAACLIKRKAIKQLFFTIKKK